MSNKLEVIDEVLNIAKDANMEIEDTTPLEDIRFYLKAIHKQLMRANELRIKAINNQLVKDGEEHKIIGITWPEDIL
tara:strand:- start:569 stop:799 length:231 start_codon:yes stop_codon:yes gene_type:complete